MQFYLFINFSLDKKCKSFTKDGCKGIWKNRRQNKKRNTKAGQYKQFWMKNIDMHTKYS